MKAIAAIAAVVQEGIDKRDLPGGVVLLARKNGAEVVHAIGLRDPANHAPMTSDVIFRIASMTKPITVAAAMILVDEGRLGLSDPVSIHLPEFKAPMVGVERRDADGRPSLLLEPAQREMTVLDLMRHTSGLTYGFIGKSLVKDRYNAANLMDRRQSNADMAAKLARLPLQNQPGSRWEYGMSIEVLGRIIEVVSGMELEQFLARRIFEPLGMTDSGFRLGDASKQQRLAQFQVDPAAGQPPMPPDMTQKSWQSGGNGLLSTAGDYARFCRMLLNGGELDGVRILSREAVERMTRDQLPAGIPSSSHRLPGLAVHRDAGNGFGLGVMVRIAEGRDGVLGHVGSYGWSGGAGTYFWIDPKAELIGIVMFQSPDLARTSAYWMRIRNLAYDVPAEP